ncbi:hypothetical protein [Dongia sp.]|uniref:hypothetical protein n=1 Tax=Dongia sp. TaxID=1977262 RepID=UPI0035B1BCB3
MIDLPTAITNIERAGQVLDRAGYAVEDHAARIAQAFDPRVAALANITGFTVKTVNVSGRDYLEVEITRIFGAPTRLLLDAAKCDQLTRKLHIGRTALRRASVDA